MHSERSGFFPNITVLAIILCALLVPDLAYGKCLYKNLVLNTISVGSVCGEPEPEFYLLLDNEEEIDLPAVQKADTTYTVSTELMWWDCNIPTLSIAVYKRNSGADDYLGATTLDYFTVINFQPFPVTTSPGDSACGNENAFMTLEITEEQEDIDNGASFWEMVGYIAAAVAGVILCVLLGIFWCCCCRNTNCSNGCTGTDLSCDCGCDGGCC